ncbi:protein kinase family protein [Mycoplasmopsis alligatoris]|uniref:Choline/ethanolamine kinase n=1 Tax=Mycoplasmopsis alligatoris A21JP2 TaxID=747682 RepID=D4XV17_9BACT|nr:choline/ethanolamine kinase [Mycoplasmopsis alligatoris]EFF41870.1 choline/ethanolamine kinase [Mycoplasmopsis alligatoris A21JP2]
MNNSSKYMHKTYWNFYKYLPDFITKHLKKVNFITYGYHNITFSGYYKKNKVLIRIPIKYKNTNKYLVNHKNEEKIYSYFKNVFYYKQGVLVKKWIEGTTLDTFDFNHRKNNWIKLKVIKKLREFHKIKIDNISKFNWNTYKNYDDDFIRKTKLFKNNSLIHGDLAAKNILLTSDNEIEFLDYEWVRKGNFLFDISTIQKTLKIDKSTLIKEFKIKSEDLDIMNYIKGEFDKFAYQNVYDEWHELINKNLSLNSNVKNPGQFIIKYKSNTSSYKKFNLTNDSKITPKIYYEDNKVCISEFIKNTCIKKPNLRVLFKCAKKINFLSTKNFKKPIFNKIPIVKQLKDLTNNSIIILELLKIIKKDYSLNSFVHYDLNAENILFLNSKNVKIIDFEFAYWGNQDFNLANIYSSYYQNNLKVNNLLKKYIVNKNDFFKSLLLCNLFYLFWTLKNAQYRNDWIGLNIQLIFKALDNLELNLIKVSKLKSQLQELIKS